MTATFKERPLLCNDEMVRSILDDRKTNTRRLMKPQPLGGFVSGEFIPPGGKYDRSIWKPGPIAKFECGTEIKCPYGVPGDRLWVQEAWRCVAWPDPDFSGEEVIEYRDKKRLPVNDHRWGSANYDNWAERMRNEGVCSVLKAGYDIYDEGDGISMNDYPYNNPPIEWRPSIHMPRWASRINLEITNVRVERVQGISEEGAIAEGVNIADAWGKSGDENAAIVAFTQLWQSIYGPQLWHDDPWVWVMEFRRMEKGEH